MKKLALVGDHDTRHSPLAMTFNNEVKRLSLEKGISMDETVKLLSGECNIGTRHIYNYRTGVTDIPSSLLPVFCRAFGSNALVMTLVDRCEVGDFEMGDAFDLINFCGQSLTDMMAGAQVFNEAVRDGKVDGHELVEVKNWMARIIRNAYRKIEIATQMRERRVA